MLSNSAKKTILQAAHHAPSADNSQPWLFDWDDTRLSVYYDFKRVSDYTFPADSPATILSMGAVMENIIQVTQALQCTTSWSISSEFNSVKDPYFVVDINNKIGVDDVMLDIALFKRHTNRLAYLDKEIPYEILEVLKKLTPPSVSLIVFNDRAEVNELSRLTKKASEIRFRTREIHEWLGKSLRFNNSTSINDGLDINTFDLPPGGVGLLKLISEWSRMNMLNRFGAYKLLAGIDSLPISSAPAVLAIVSKSGYEDILSAGQVMNRIWIYLNTHGLAVQPYYVIPDQLYRREASTIPKGMEKQADDLFIGTNNILKLNEGEKIQMLLRIGYPKKQPTFSKRLPLETVCFQKDIGL